MSREIKANRILISATGSGKGKTTVTLGLLKALKDMGLDVDANKCGPDYIDPMYHHSVVGVPSKNLDPFFCDEDLLKASFADSCAIGDNAINVCEGAMGLFDGIGVTSQASAYTVATMLNMPIILLVDAYGAGYSIVASIKGFLADDVNHLIKGVFLNRISADYASRLIPVIEEKCQIPVVGFLPKTQDLMLESRYLGLKAPEENNIEEKLSVLTELIKKNVRLEKFIEIANAAEPLSVEMSLSERITKVTEKNPVIAVAKDEAFSFYYEDNLKALSLAGAELIEFSPLKDKHLPSNCSGLLLGGGYPENYVEKLLANESLISDIKEACSKGIPIIAECGGFMYLHYIGILNGEVFHAGRSVRFGYIELEGNGYKIKGHEFHHYDVDTPGDAFDVKPASGKASYKAMVCKKGLVAGFPHLYYFSDPMFAENFVERAVEYNNGK